MGKDKKLKVHTLYTVTALTCLNCKNAFKLGGQPLIQYQEILPFVEQAHVKAVTDAAIICATPKLIATYVPQMVNHEAYQELSSTITTDLTNNGNGIIG